MEKTIESLKAEIQSLTDHIATLSKDTEEYDRAIANLSVLNQSLVNAEKALHEKKLKDREEIQAIKAWKAEHELSLSKADEEHFQFMFKTIVDVVMRSAESVMFINMHDEELIFERDYSHSVKFWPTLMNRLPWMRGRNK